MRIEVNDEEYILPDGASVAALLEQLQLPRTRVAVEVNRAIVRRVDHPTTLLHDGDKIEVVTLVGGG